jgi:magnesium-protoporphyrin O-methyltransferase
VYDRQFDGTHAERKLRELRRRGPNRTTAQLVDELAAGGIEGLTVLDIGAGVGAVHLGLLERGAASATDVDASAPYLAAARDEAQRRGLADRVTYHRGDAVRIVPELPPADLVALDRVVCCYGDMPGLMRAAGDRTRRRLGIVIPRDRWWVRAGLGLENVVARIRRDRFRVYAHRTAAVIEAATAAGLVVSTHQRGFVWQTLVFERP